MFLCLVEMGRVVMVEEESSGNNYDNIVIACT